MATSILVVDDSQVERVLVEGLLCKNPEYRVQLAANGREALEAIAATMCVQIGIARAVATSRCATSEPTTTFSSSR